MKTLKSIDGKSLLIGGLLASTILLATGAKDNAAAAKWDKEQEWLVMKFDNDSLLALKVMREENWEPFACDEDDYIWARKRFK